MNNTKITPKMARTAEKQIKERMRFEKRRASVLAQEYSEPERWMYLSFAGEHFNGAVVIKAHGIADAVSRTHLLGINPGGQVFGVDMPDDILKTVPENFRTRLLTREEIQSIWPDAKTVREFDEEDNS